MTPLADGPAVHAQPLLTTAELEQLQFRTLEHGLRSRHRATSPILGQRPSLFRGQGMELEDVRAYQAGDDVRYMDWRATARSGKPIMKVFREERSQGLFLMIDRRPSMGFGTRGELKAATAARVAAILAFSAVAARDLVAGMVVDGSEKFFSGVRGAANALPLLRAASAPFINTHVAQKIVAMHSLLEQIDRAAGRGASVCLISDFKDMRAEHAPLLLQLAAHHEVLALRIVDPAEEVLSNAGKLRMALPTGEIFVIDTSDANIRARYADAMAKHTASLAQLFERVGIALWQVHTHKDAFAQLESIRS